MYLVSKLFFFFIQNCGTYSMGHIRNAEPQNGSKCFFTYTTFFSLQGTLLYKFHVILKTLITHCHV